ncbi:hypothetical protein P0082_05395 [Candidatus Haliotispira prima]|uniref:Uncharacterized protein n=1 Tax=Candidatus Haliotispira prima TaxID=3034016 RepID=A0ABY8MJU0_9SPIO|nr:hypothetical protein P0082_05395 [Candidatus Haliotispira prima]
MVLHSEDYQFRKMVSFVRMDEYHNEQKTGHVRMRDKWRQTFRPQYKQSQLHFTEGGLLSFCSSRFHNADEVRSEEVHCHYENSLLLKRVFRAQGDGLDMQREENRIYNEQNLLTEKNILENDVLQKCVHYSYDGDFRLIKEEYLQHSKIYLYNNKDLCREERIYHNNEHTKSLLYQYDDNDNIVELWEESPVGRTCRLHKYSYNRHQLISNYQLINQDGLVLSNLEYKYSNFIGDDWLERYTWQLGGRSGKLSRHLVHSCMRSPCLDQSSSEELGEHFRHSGRTLELPEGSYQGQVQVGVMHGHGRLDFFDGSCYIGNFDAGRMSGYGSFYWPDKRIYQGYFENNKMEGRGNYYLADGSLYQGIFSEGQLLSDKPYYFLPGDSVLSRKNRARKNQSRENYRKENREGLASDRFAGRGSSRPGTNSEQEFIEIAAQAVQQRLREQAEAEAAAAREALGLSSEDVEAEESNIRRQQIEYAKAKSRQIIDQFGDGTVEKGGNSSNQEAVESDSQELESVDGLFADEREIGDCIGSDNTKEDKVRREEWGEGRTEERAEEQTEKQGEDWANFYAEANTVMGYLGSDVGAGPAMPDSRTGSPETVSPGEISPDEKPDCLQDGVLQVSQEQFEQELQQEFLDYLANRRLQESESGTDSEVGPEMEFGPKAKDDDLNFLWSEGGAGVDHCETGQDEMSDTSQDVFYGEVTGLEAAKSGSGDKVTDKTDTLAGLHEDVAPDQNQSSVRDVVSGLPDRAEAEGYSDLFVAHRLQLPEEQSDGLHIPQHSELRVEPDLENRYRTVQPRMKK